jgi:hypothetical protein
LTKKTVEHDEVMMKQLLHIEDLMMTFKHNKNISNQVETFVNKYETNPYAISQITDIIISSLIDIGTINCNGFEEFPYSEQMIEKLCKCSNRFTSSPIVIERIISALGSIVENNRCTPSSIALVLKTILATVQQTDNVIIIELVCLSLDTVVNTIVKIGGNTEIQSCVDILMQEIASQDGNQSSNNNIMLSHLFTAVGNLIASPLLTNEIETFIVNSAIERGIIELSLKIVKENSVDEVLISVWHFLEQCTHSAPVSETCAKKFIVLANESCNNLASSSMSHNPSSSAPKIMSSIYLTLSNLIVCRNYQLIPSELKRNGMLEQMLSMPEKFPNDADIVWSSLHLFQNVMISSNEGSLFTQWLCLQQNGFHMMLNALENSNGDRFIQRASCDAIRTALISDGFPSFLNSNQLTKLRMQLSKLLLDILGEGRNLENGIHGTNENLQKEQPELEEDLVETILLCIVRIKLYISVEEYSSCLSQVHELSKFISLTTKHTRIKLLWDDMKKDITVDNDGSREEGDEASSCVIV